MQKWEGWFAWRCINQAMRSEMVSSLVFGEKIHINWHVKRGFVSIKSREGKPRLYFLTLVLLVRTYLSCLGLGLALPNFATHFCQACLKFSKWEGGTLAHGCRGRTAPSHGHSCTPRSHRTLTQSLLHAANPTKVTDPQSHVLSHVNKPNSAILSLTLNFRS